jgi:hypothetical protein
MRVVNLTLVRSELCGHYRSLRGVLEVSRATAYVCGLCITVVDSVLCRYLLRSAKSLGKFGLNTVSNSLDLCIRATV